jgi:Icc protein
MPGCDFTRRDMLRWTAFAAAAPVLGLADPARAHAAIGASGTREIEPVNLELVTLTEDRAVITWYTGEAGTNDGLGRMVPAPADGEVWYGTDPARLKNVAGDISGNTPYHYVELSDLEPGQPITTRRVPRVRTQRRCSSP